MSRLLFVYEFVSPGSDLDGEPIYLIDSSRETADGRAASLLKDTFGWASPERRAKSSIRFIEEKPVTPLSVRERCLRGYP